MKAIRAAVCALAVTCAAPALAQDKVVRNFEPGVGPNAVGMIEPGEDTEGDGPQAIYAGGNGEIYLLDQLNGRVLELDPNDPTKDAKVLQLPDDIQPTDIVVANDTIYAWDGEIRALQATGAANSPTRSLSVTRSLTPPDDTIAGVFAQMGSQEIADEEPATLTRSLGKPRPATGRGRQNIASHGRGAVTAVVSPFAKDSGVNINLSVKGGGSPFAKLRMQVRARLGVVEVLNVDKQGRVFVLGENIPTDYGAATAFVARYASAGNLEGIYELPLTSQVSLSRRFVTVSPEGEVYFLRNQKGKTDVLGVSFRYLRANAVIDPGPPQQAYTLSDFSKKFRGANAAVRTPTRAQVIETGMAFANIRWRVNPGAYGSDPDSACSGFNRVRRPGYLHGKMNKEVQGIPYCWGCMGSLPQIATNLERGVKAGNICTRNDPRRDVTGVDCSAFVSATWGLSTHFTTIAIPSITRQIDPFEMLPGDAFNKPGSHVMLFVRFTADKKAEVLEAATGGCNGRVCRNVYPIGSLLARGYKPVRYRGLANDTSSPTAGAVANAAPVKGRAAPGREGSERGR